MVVAFPGTFAFEVQQALQKMTVKNLKNNKGLGKQLRDYLKRLMKFKTGAPGDLAVWNDMRHYGYEKAADLVRLVGVLMNAWDKLCNPQVLIKACRNRVCTNIKKFSNVDVYYYKQFKTLTSSTGSEKNIIDTFLHSYVDAIVWNSVARIMGFTELEELSRKSRSTDCVSFTTVFPHICKKTGAD